MSREVIKSLQYCLHKVFEIVEISYPAEDLPCQWLLESFLYILRECLWDSLAISHLVVSCSVFGLFVPGFYPRMLDHLGDHEFYVIAVDVPLATSLY